MDNNKAAPLSTPADTEQARDAARYRYLRNNCNDRTACFEKMFGQAVLKTNDKLDAAIDIELGLATPADAGVGEALTNERIIEIADQTRTAESRDGDYILPISFAREIEKELARLSKPGAPVTAEPAAWMTKDGERVVSAATKAGQLRDGGASKSAMAPYTIPLVRATHSAPADRDAIHDQALYAAAQALMREALDCAHVHPCDYHDDDARARTLPTEMQELYRALKSMERAADSKGGAA